MFLKNTVCCVCHQFGLFEISLFHTIIRLSLLRRKYSLLVCITDISVIYLFKLGQGKHYNLCNFVVAFFVVAKHKPLKSKDAPLHSVS
jgi:hypothetical protein